MVKKLIKLSLAKLIIILAIFGLTSWVLQANMGLPAPKYLSNPYFLDCKAKCPLVQHETYTSLNMPCIEACILFYEGKSQLDYWVSDLWEWLE